MRETCHEPSPIRCTEGFGADESGQNSTKVAGTLPKCNPDPRCPSGASLIISKVRACRNAIEFSHFPLDPIPNGRDGLKFDVLLAVPWQYQNNLDLTIVHSCFPYEQVYFQIQDGGMVVSSGTVIDGSDDCVVVCAAVSVGYGPKYA